MDYKEEIQLESKKNINSVDIDKYINIQLENKNSIFTDYNITKFINSSDVFEEERENVETYRVYGTINYISLLNGLPTDYDKISDFFIKKINPSNHRDFINSFDIYLLKPSDSFEYIKDNLYYKYYEILATPNDINIKRAGFQKNIFNEDVYYFDFNLDFDIKNQKDGLGFPITEFYLYFIYKPLLGSGGDDESIMSVDFRNVAAETPQHFIGVEPSGDVGDVLINVKNDENLKICTIIELDKKNYKQTIKYQDLHIINTRIVEYNENYNSLKFFYNPFLKINLRYLSGDLNFANRNSTSYEQRENIPYYAIDLDSDGNAVWREILSDGVFDVTTNNGVDHPFVNKRKYTFTNLILECLPALGQDGDTDGGESILPKPNPEEDPTSEIFNEILFGDPKIISINPNNDDIDKIGKKCQ